jgi:hypothetical protein
MKKLSEYQQRKADGKCVRRGCKRTPRMAADGKHRRSYCDFHNAQNARNYAAYIERLAAKHGKKPSRKADCHYPGKPKASKKPKAKPKAKPAPVATPATPVIEQPEKAMAACAGVTA